MKEQLQSEQETSNPDISVSKVIQEDSSLIVRKRSTFKKKRDANLDEDPLEVSMKLKHDKLDEEKAA